VLGTVEKGPHCRVLWLRRLPSPEVQCTFILFAPYSKISEERDKVQQKDLFITKQAGTAGFENSQLLQVTR
jgi:hypothetical protein